MGHLAIRFLFAVLPWVILPLFALPLVLSVVPVFAQTLRGDVNGDGIVDEKDALAVERHLSGQALLTEEQLQRADVFPRTLGEDGDLGDGQVTLDDALVLLRVAVGLVSLGELDMSSRLEGDPASLAWNAIVPRPIPSPDPEEISPSEALGGMLVSRTRLSVLVHEEATVGQVNAAIQVVEGEIIGSIPEIGMLLLDVPDGGTSARAERAVAVLRGAVGIQDAGLDLLLNLLEGEADSISPKVPAPSTLTNAAGNSIWAWRTAPGGGNWGMEYIHMPQAWNLSDYVRRRNAPGVRVSVMDVAFQEGSFHPDLRGLQVSDLAVNKGDSTRADHGMHVAGTVGATVDNRTPPNFYSIGVDGANPVVRLVGVPWGSPWLAKPADANPKITQLNSMGSRFVSIVGRTLLVNPHYPRVVNASLGFNWYSNATLNPYTHADSTAIEAAVAHWGRIVSAIVNVAQELRGPVLLCVAAGNDSNKPGTGNVRLNSRLGSPFTWAAHNGNANIVVVENIRINGTLASSSNNQGTVAAPGTGILSTVSATTTDITAFSGAYNVKSGTSMASPHVTGLVSYLLAIDPTLTNAELRTLITTLPNPNTPAPGVANSAPIVDAWRAAMHIDVLRGDRKVQAGLCNVDDGTAHGNDPRLSSMRLDAAGAVIAVTGDGADAITMADFRRFRDALLAVGGRYPLAQVDSFNVGSTAALIAQMKRKCADANQNGLLSGDAVPGGGAENDNIYPRFDFNGDGRLSLTRRDTVNSALDGRIGQPPTDLEVLADLWPAAGDEGWQKNQLVTLLNSGDLEIDADALLAAGSGDVTLRFKRADGTLAPERRVRASGERPVVSLPIAAGAASANWQVSASRLFNSVDSLEARVDVAVRVGRLDTLDIAPVAFRIEPIASTDPLRAFAAAGPGTPADFASFSGTPIRIVGGGFKPATEQQITFASAPPIPAQDTLQVIQSGQFGLPLTVPSGETQLLARVPSNATTERLEVRWTHGGRTVTSRTVNDLWVLGPPEVTDMTPSSGHGNDEIVIRGRNFGYDINNVIVRFSNGESPAFDGFLESVSNGTLRLTVPLGTESGPVQVITPAGTAEAGFFTREEGLRNGAEIYVNSSLDTNAPDRVLTLREAILLATGNLGRVLADDDDEDDVRDDGSPGILEEGDYVFGTPGAGRADVIRFVDPGETTPRRLRQTEIRSISLTAPLPPLDTGYDFISGGQADFADPTKVYRVDPARVTVQAGSVPSGTPALSIPSDGNEIRLGFVGGAGPGIAISGNDNRLIGVRVTGGIDLDSPAILIDGGDRNRLGTCVLNGNQGDGIEMRGGAVGNFFESCLVYDNRRGLFIHGPGTDKNRTNANYFGLGSVEAGGEKVEFEPGNRQQGVLIEDGAQGNEITHGRIAGNKGSGLVVRGSGTDDTLVRGGEEVGSEFDIFVGGQDTTASGASWGNGGHGILVEGGAQRTHILNASVLANTGDGIHIAGAGTDGTTIESSKIGQVSGDFTRVVTAGNGGSGIAIRGDAQGNAPGGTRVLPQTIISANGEYGIRITDVRNRDNPTLLRSPLNIGFLPGALSHPPASPQNIAPPHGLAGMRIERSEYIVFEGAQESYETDNIMAGEKFGIQIIDSNYLSFGHYFVGRSSQIGILLVNSHFNTFRGTRAIWGANDGWVLVNSSNNTIEPFASFFSGSIRPAGAHNDSGRGLVIGMGSRDNVLRGVTVHDNGGDGVVLDASYLPPPEQLPADRPVTKDDIADTTTRGTRIVECEIGIENGPIPLGNRGHGLVVRGGATQTEVLRNAISANSRSGILVGAIGDTATAAIDFYGNHVGTHPDGSASPGYGNGGHGLEIVEARDIDIGGLGAGSGNVFAGNSGDGVRLDETRRIRLYRNYHGLAADGETVWANKGHGLTVDNATDVLVGSSQEGLGNVFSGNDGNGIRLEGGDFSRIRIRNNRIGLNAEGTAVLGNGNNGIRVQGGAGLVMDQTNRSDIGPSNIIAGNQAQGILVDGVTGIRIFENTIGQNAEGELSGNAEDGISLSTAPGSLVRDNRIQGNGGAGIAVNLPVSRGSTLRGNWIGGNGGKGIVLFNETVAVPQLRVAANRRISGRVDLPNGSFIELFGAVDGQGTEPLAVAQVSGRQFFFPVGVPERFGSITATATAVDGSMSEFGPPATVVRAR
jgi:hypothetical protein